MDMMIFVWAFIGAGFAGLIMGMFGGGVGLVLVPLLIWVLRLEGVSNQLLMHVAIGTTLAAIVVIGLVASYKQHQKGSIHWPTIRIMVIGLLIGVAIGSVIAGHLPSKILMVIFGCFVILLAFYIWLSTKQGKDKKVQPAILRPSLVAGSAIIGFIGSVLGANPLCVPLLKKLGYDIHEAVGTTTVIGTIMAVAIVIMFITVGWGAEGLPAYSTGFVDWPLFVPVAIASSLFAPLGVRLANFLPKRLLQVLYGCLLLVIGIKMILMGSFHH